MHKLASVTLISALLAMSGTVFAQATSTTNPSAIPPAIPGDQNDPMQNPPPTTRDLEMRHRDQQHIERNDAIRPQSGVENDLPKLPGSETEIDRP